VKSTVTISCAAATGERYCLTHLAYGAGDDRTIIPSSNRYEDTIQQWDGTWLFSERRLYVDWIDTRPISP